MKAPQGTDELDAAALRDLGLDRSELSSLAAEIEGRAPLTRRRAGASGAAARPAVAPAGRPATPWWPRAF